MGIQGNFSEEKLKLNLESFQQQPQAHQTSTTTEFSLKMGCRNSKCCLTSKKSTAKPTDDTDMDITHQDSSPQPLAESTSELVKQRTVKTSERAILAENDGKPSLMISRALYKLYQGRRKVQERKSCNQAEPNRTKTSFAKPDPRQLGSMQVNGPTQRFSIVRDQTDVDSVEMFTNFSAIDDADYSSQVQLLKDDKSSSATANAEVKIKPALNVFAQEAIKNKMKDKQTEHQLNIKRSVREALQKVMSFTDEQLRVISDVLAENAKNPAKIQALEKINAEDFKEENQKLNHLIKVASTLEAKYKQWQELLFYLEPHTFSHIHLLDIVCDDQYLLTKVKLDVINEPRDGALKDLMLKERLLMYFDEQILQMVLDLYKRDGKTTLLKWKLLDSLQAYSLKSHCMKHLTPEEVLTKIYPDLLPKESILGNNQPTVPLNEESKAGNPVTCRTQKLAILDMCSEGTRQQIMECLKKTDEEEYKRLVLVQQTSFDDLVSSPVEALKETLNEHENSFKDIEIDSRTETFDARANPHEPGVFVTIQKVKYPAGYALSSVTEGRLKELKYENGGNQESRCVLSFYEFESSNGTRFSSSLALEMEPVTGLLMSQWDEVFWLCCQNGAQSAPESLSLSILREDRKVELIRFNQDSLLAEYYERKWKHPHNFDIWNPELVKINSSRTLVFHSEDKQTINFYDIDKKRHLMKTSLTQQIRFLYSSLLQNGKTLLAFSTLTNDEQNLNKKCTTVVSKEFGEKDFPESGDCFEFTIPLLEDGTFGPQACIFKTDLPRLQPVSSVFTNEDGFVDKVILGNYTCMLLKVREEDGKLEKTDTPVKNLTKVWLKDKRQVYSTTESMNRNELFVQIWQPGKEEEEHLEFNLQEAKLKDFDVRAVLADIDSESKEALIVMRHRNSQGKVYFWQNGVRQRLQIMPEYTMRSHMSCFSFPGLSEVSIQNLLDGNQQRVRLDLKGLQFVQFVEEIRVQCGKEARVQLLARKQETEFVLVTIENKELLQKHKNRNTCSFNHLQVTETSMSRLKEILKVGRLRKVVASGTNLAICQTDKTVYCLNAKTRTDLTLQKNKVLQMRQIEMVHTLFVVHDKSTNADIVAVAKTTQLKYWYTHEEAKQVLAMNWVNFDSQSPKVAILDSKSVITVLAGSLDKTGQKICAVETAFEVPKSPIAWLNISCTENSVTFQNKVYTEKQCDTLTDQLQNKDGASIAVEHKVFEPGYLLLTKSKKLIFMPNPSSAVTTLPQGYDSEFITEKMLLLKKVGERNWGMLHLSRGLQKVPNELLAVLTSYEWNSFKTMQTPRATPLVLLENENHAASVELNFSAEHVVEIGLFNDYKRHSLLASNDKLFSVHFDDSSPHREIEDPSQKGGKRRGSIESIISKNKRNEATQEQSSKDEKPKTQEQVEKQSLEQDRRIVQSKLEKTSLLVQQERPIKASQALSSKKGSNLHSSMEENTAAPKNKADKKLEEQTKRVTHKTIEVEVQRTKSSVGDKNLFRIDIQIQKVKDEDVDLLKPIICGSYLCFVRKSTSVVQIVNLSEVLTLKWRDNEQKKPLTLPLRELALNCEPDCLQISACTQPLYLRLKKKNCELSVKDYTTIDYLIFYQSQCKDAATSEAYVIRLDQEMLPVINQQAGIYNEKAIYNRIQTSKEMPNQTQTLSIVKNTVQNDLRKPFTQKVRKQISAVRAKELLKTYLSIRENKGRKSSEDYQFILDNLHQRVKGVPFFSLFIDDDPGFIEGFFKHLQILQEQELSSEIKQDLRKTLCLLEPFAQSLKEKEYIAEDTSSIYSSILERCFKSDQIKLRDVLLDISSLIGINAITAVPNISGIVNAIERSSPTVINQLNSCFSENQWTEKVNLLQWPRGVSSMTFTYEGLDITQELCQKEVDRKFRHRSPNTLVKVKVLDISFIYNDNSNFPAFVSKVINAKDMTTFNTSMLTRLIDKFWLQNYKRILSCHLLPFVVYCISTIVFLTLSLQPESFNLEEDVYKVVIGLLSFALWVNLVHQEIRQFQQTRRRYFKSPINYCDLVNLGSFPFIVAAKLAPEEWISIESQRRLGALISCTLVLKAFDWTRLFQGTAFYIQLIIETLKDIKYFMILFLLSLALSGLPTMFLNFDSEEDSSMVMKISGQYHIDAFLSQFIQSINGPETDPIEENKHSVIAIIMVFLLSIFTQIIILNMLIAIMGDTFSRVIEKRQMHATRTKLGFLAQFDYDLTQKNLSKEKQRIFLYEITALDAEDDDDFSQRWQGSITRIQLANKKCIEKAKAETSREILQMAAQIKQLDQRVTEALSQGNRLKTETCKETKSLAVKAEEPVNLLREDIMGSLSEITKQLNQIHSESRSEIESIKRLLNPSARRPSIEQVHRNFMNSHQKQRLFSDDE